MLSEDECMEHFHKLVQYFKDNNIEEDMGYIAYKICQRACLVVQLNDPLFKEDGDTFEKRVETHLRTPGGAPFTKEYLLTLKANNYEN